MKSLILIGFMGTGKQPWVKNWPSGCNCLLVDLDTVIVQEQQMEIGEILSVLGKKHFGRWSMRCCVVTRLNPI